MPVNTRIFFLALASALLATGGPAAPPESSPDESLGAAVSQAAENPTLPEDLEAALLSARQSLDEGLPTIAWSRLAATGLGDTYGSSPESVRRTFAEASFASGKPELAADILRSLTAPSPGDHFLLAQSLMAMGDPAGAAHHFEMASAGPDPGPPAQIGHARALAALGRHEEAVVLIEPLAERGDPRAGLDLAAALLDSGASGPALDRLAAIRPTTPAEFAERDYLAARATLDTNDAAAAARLLETHGNFPASIAAQAVILESRALLQLGKIADAENALETFIASHGKHPEIRSVFAALDAVYARQESPSSTALREWRKEGPDGPRPRLAQFYLGLNEIRLRRADRALDAFRAFLESSPDDPLADRARWHATLLLLQDERPADALKLLDGQPGPLMHFARGRVLAALQRLHDAAAEFSAAGENFPGAAFNASLCRIRAGEPVAASGPDASELAFARAISLADNSPVEAARALETIVSSGHEPWASSSAFALAELSYEKLDLADARRQLHRISHPTTAGDDAPAALDVFLQDDGTPDSADRVLDAASKFLSNFPDSRRRADVAMKMAEVLYRRGDFVAARAGFESAATESPGSPLAEKARFLSAQAASRTMDPSSMEEAIDTYEAIARGEGPMAPRARFAQALLLNALGRPDEALAVIDNLLSAQPDTSLRAAALVEKGDTLFSLGATNPKNYLDAIAAWKPLTTQETSPRWRNQALCKTASAESALGHMEAALATYADAFSSPPGDEPEYFWYYKAGFEAARLLEENGRHQEAIAVYQKLAADDGPRSQEARDRINRLRLENLLWEE